MVNELTVITESMTNQQILDKMNVHLSEFWHLAQEAGNRGFNSMKVNGCIFTVKGQPLILINGKEKPFIQEINTNTVA